MAFEYKTYAFVDPRFDEKTTKSPTNSFLVTYELSRESKIYGLRIKRLQVGPSREGICKRYSERRANGREDV